ncbi:hypothetical protein SCUCBS95973_009530 [Sporothrix curviconia]|uniref:Thioesterase domain-containing protein n=1 Tax=Sporothrix curviconia TaxID=1260050 RepID=A0ABP0CZ67_9PEZI
MVVRIPATAWSLAARAVARPSTVSTTTASASAFVSHRCLSSQPQRQQQQQQQQTPLPQYFPPQQPPPPKKRRIQRSTYIFLAIGTLISTASTMFVLQRPVPFEEMYPRGSEKERQFKEAEAGHADDFALVKALQADPDWEEWDVGQRWRAIDAKEAAADIPGGELVDMADVSADVTSGHVVGGSVVVAPPTPQRTRLTTGALGGAEGMGAYHRIFHNTQTGAVVSVMRIGRAMAGWPGTAHGGALATILDEALGRCAILAFPARTGVTARLELTYRKPVQTGQFYVVKCTPEFPPPPPAAAADQPPPPELRKLWCSASLESMAGEVHVAAKGLFVVPRKYKLGKVEDKF